GVGDGLDAGALLGDLEPQAFSRRHAGSPATPAMPSARRTRVRAARAGSRPAPAVPLPRVRRSSSLRPQEPRAPHPLLRPVPSSAQKAGGSVLPPSPKIPPPKTSLAERARRALEGEA